MMRMENNKIEDMFLASITGGGATPPITPDNENPIDEIINGKYYDAIAEQLAEWLTRLAGQTDSDYFVRKRKVDNSQDIYDVDI